MKRETINLDTPDDPKYQYVITRAGAEMAYQFSDKHRAEEVREVSVSAHGEINVSEIEEV